MANLSYFEALHGILSDSDVEALVGLVEAHKIGGSFRTRMPADVVVALIDEIKRLREQVGGYKKIPAMESGDK